MSSLFSRPNNGVAKVTAFALHHKKEFIAKLGGKLEKGRSRGTRQAGQVLGDCISIDGNAGCNILEIGIVLVVIAKIVQFSHFIVN